MAQEALPFTTPAGRLVSGSVHTPRTKDQQGNPLVIKRGPDAGKPRVDHFFAIAIPKQAGQHWAHTEWGAKIWQAGHAYVANASQIHFAWKIEDGDDQTPNQDANNRRNCDREGWAGHWVVKFSGGFAPTLYTLVGTAKPEPVAQVGAINLGDYVQVHGSVVGNGASGAQAGVYLNHSMVCLVAYGPRISIGADPATAGFAVPAQLPAGASMTPLGGFTPPVVPGAAPSRPAIPGMPVTPTAAPGAVYPMPVAQSPALVIQPNGMPATVVPNPAFLQVPAAPGGFNLQVPARQMLPAAGGASYADFIAKGWTDALLVQHGMMS